MLTDDYSVNFKFNPRTQRFTYAVARASDGAVLMRGSRGYASLGAAAAIAEGDLVAVLKQEQARLRKAA